MFSRLEPKNQDTSLISLHYFGDTVVYVILKSCSHFVPSLDFSQWAVIVSPLLLKRASKHKIESIITGHLKKMLRREQ